MTATMAAKDTNQLTRNKASAINSSYPLGQQPFYHQQQQPPAIANRLTAPTTITTTIASPSTTQTTMAARAINIGFTSYTHAYLQRGSATDGEIVNERVQRDEMVSNRVAAANAVDVAVDDDKGNVDGTGNIYKDSVASKAPTAGTATVLVVDDINLDVDTCTGVPTAGGIEVLDVGGGGADDEDESDSFGSMETLSDNVAVWVDGEKHWVAGVDANTTCAELIGALLNYQNAQLMQQKRYEQQKHQHMFNVNNGKNNNCCKNNNNSKVNDNNTTSTSFVATATATATNSFITNSKSIAPNTAINQSALIKTSTNTKENCAPLLAASHSVELTVGGCHPAALSATALTVPTTGSAGRFNCLAEACEYVIVKQHRHCEEYLDGNAKVFDVLPAHDGPARKECELLLRRLAAANSSNNTINHATFTEFPADTLHRPSSPSLNLNTQVSSLLSTDKDSGMGSPVGSSRSARLRRRKYKSAATVSWLAQANTLHPRVSQRAVAAFSGLNTQLTNAHGDSGKHIAVIEQALGENGLNTDALKGLSGGGGGGAVSANERLLKIILAQDETIHRQLALLREKERQISKIEEEKHRVRERELGKNYLLETYLNGLDEANVEAELDGGTDVGVFADSPLNEFNDVRHADTIAATDAAASAIDPVSYASIGSGGHGDGKDNDVDLEIFIDEPYHRTVRKTVAHITAAPTTKKDIITGKTRDFNLDARHSKKMKEDFTGGGGCGGGCGIDVVMTEEKIDANEPLAAAKCHGNEKEIDAQLFWLEKIHALNKQLQREEEILLKLHAKIRKHQVKRAYQTKHEVLQQIEKLDAELTLQCCDIRAVESKLHASNEQLKQKLGVLERLSQEFLETMDQAAQATEAVERGVALVAADAEREATVNRMPDIINNEDHSLAPELEWRARGNKVQQAADQLHAKQRTTEQFGGQQQSCQLQSQTSGMTVEDVWHRQDANYHLLHAMPPVTQVLGRDSNVRSDSKALLEESTASAEIVTVQSPAKNVTTTTTKTKTAVENVATAMAASHPSAAAPKLTATSCAASPSMAKMTIQATTITTTAPSATKITRTTTNTTADVTTATTATTSPAEDKQITALHLPQQQLPQLRQEQQLALPEDDNLQQCVDADDVLVDALAAVGGVFLPQSNYPISCINHAAIHATSQLSTRQITVAAGGDGRGGGDGGDGANTTVAGKLTPEQTLSAAYATLSPSPSSLPVVNTSIIQQQQQPQLQHQPHHYQPQLLSQRQHINMQSYMNGNCLSNHNYNSKDNHTNDKNVVPPSHAAHTKTLQKQMFGSKSLNQMLPAAPPPKITQASAVTMTTPSISTPTPTVLTPSPHAGTHGGFVIPPMSAPLRPTTPTTLLPPTHAIPFDVTTKRSSVDITQLGTLV